MNLDEYTQLKEKTDRLRKKRDRAEGALSQLMKKLREEFGISTVEEAKKKLKEMERETEKAEEEYDAARDEFVEKWAEKLEEA